MNEFKHDKPEMIRIALADDQAMIRQGLRLIIETQKDMRVVGGRMTGAKPSRWPPSLNRIWC